MLLDRVEETAGEPRHRRDARLVGKPAVERIVLDGDRHERAAGPARVAQRKAAHVVGGRIGQHQRAVVAVELQPMAAAEIRRRSSSTRLPAAPDAKRELQRHASVSNAGSSGRPDSRADRPVDRPAEPFEIVQRVADEIAERAAAGARRWSSSSSAAAGSTRSRRSRSRRRGAAAPIAPPSSSALAFCHGRELGESRNRSWPAAAPACRGMAAAPARSAAIGFSTNTGLPRLSAATAISGCSRGGTAIATASMSGRSIICAQSPKRFGNVGLRAPARRCAPRPSPRAPPRGSANPPGTRAVAPRVHSCSRRSPGGSRTLPAGSQSARNLVGPQAPVKGCRVQATLQSTSAAAGGTVRAISGVFRLAANCRERRDDRRRAAHRRAGDDGRGARAAGQRSRPLRGAAVRRDRDLFRFDTGSACGGGLRRWRSSSWPWPARCCGPRRASTKATTSSSSHRSAQGSALERVLPADAYRQMAAEFEARYPRAQALHRRRPPAAGRARRRSRGLCLFRRRDSRRGRLFAPRHRNGLLRSGVAAPRRDQRRLQLDRRQRVAAQQARAALEAAASVAARHAVLRDGPHAVGIHRQPAVLAGAAAVGEGCRAFRPVAKCGARLPHGRSCRYRPDDLRRRDLRLRCGCIWSRHGRSVCAGCIEAGAGVGGGPCRPAAAGPLAAAADGAADRR